MRVVSVMAAYATVTLTLQDRPYITGIHEIKKSNVVAESIPVLLCIWDIHNPETNSYMFPVFFLKLYRQMPSFFLGTDGGCSSPSLHNPVTALLNLLHTSTVNCIIHIAPSEQPFPILESGILVI